MYPTFTVMLICEGRVSEAKYSSPTPITKILEDTYGEDWAKMYTVPQEELGRRISAFYRILVDKIKVKPPLVNRIGQKFKAARPYLGTFEIVQLAVGDFPFLASDGGGLLWPVNTSGKIQNGGALQQLLADELIPIKLEVGKTYKDSDDVKWHIIRRSNDLAKRDFLGVTVHDIMGGHRREALFKEDGSVVSATTKCPLTTETPHE